MDKLHNALTQLRTSRHIRKLFSVVFKTFDKQVHTFIVIAKEGIQSTLYKMELDIMENSI